MRLADIQGTAKRLIVMRPIKRIFADNLTFLLLYAYLFISNIYYPFIILY
jgi:hypothetical protein